MLSAVQPLPAAADWLLRPRREQQTETSLILFPYAGLGASLAAILSRFITIPVAVHGVQLPGRENRVAEPPLSAMPSIVEALLPVIAPLAQRPYVLMGCSFGALIAYELALRLQALGLPPRHFIALACACPTLGRFRTNLSHLDDAALLEALDARFGGVPAAVKQNQELQRLFLPALRADIKVLDTYEWRQRPVLAAPLLTIGGTLDREVSAGDLALWGELCSGPATQSMVQGGHFVLRENPAAVAAVLNARLGTALV